MKAVKPTIFLAVPRVFEKVRQATEHKATGLRGKIFNWALATGKKHRKEIMAGKQPSSLALEAGQQAGLFQAARGLWRARQSVRLRRRSAGHGLRGVVSGCEHPHL
jgi:long-subunit acyl-CoA synthetase (AMP-forming)